MAKPAKVISQWCQLLEHFQASSQDFYQEFERAVESRAVPQTHWARVGHKEAGIGSGSREYLRMHRGKYAFDICAAPFGNGFFVSWWFTEPPLPFGWVFTLAFFVCVIIAMYFIGGIGLAIGGMLFGLTYGSMIGGLFAVVGTPLMLWLVGNWIRHGQIKGESTVLGMPIVGYVYERVFAPTTYYSIDTALMFQQAIHNSILEVVDSMTATQGIRGLSAAERKPVMKYFSASA